MDNTKYYTKLDKGFWIFCGMLLVGWVLAIGLLFHSLGYWAILVGFGIMVISRFFIYFVMRL